MQQSGEYIVNAERDPVWTALNDPVVLAACIPGCQSIERVADDEFVARVKAKIGPVSATFDAQLKLNNIVAPQSYTISGDVKGGTVGFAKGEADVALAEHTDGTLLTYTVNANVGGKLAQIGSRLVDSATRKMADDFFAAFRDQLAPTAVEMANQESQVEDEKTNEITSETAAPSARYENEGNKMIWGIAFVVLGLALLLAV